MQKNKSVHTKWSWICLSQYMSKNSCSCSHAAAHLFTRTMHYLIVQAPIYLPISRARGMWR